MPEDMAIRINAYTDPMDRQMRIRGKMMLTRLLSDFGLNQTLHLGHVRYSATNRPNLAPDFDFSIAHSGKMVICGGVLKGRIGLDIEHVNSAETDAFETFFTTKEWKQIKKAQEPRLEFYRFWTRKEALFKAAGSGILSEFSKTDVCSESPIELQGRFYSLQNLNIHPGFVAHTAMDTPGLNISIRKF